MTDRLLTLLRERSYREGRVTLASGKQSDFFIDVKQAALAAEGHALIADAMLSEIGRLQIAPDAVAGVALGGCPLASAVSLVSHQRGAPLDAVYVRKAEKQHGSARRVEGHSHLDSGASVVMLEDVLTTGGSTLSAVETLREQGLTVRSVVAVVDRGEGAADALAEAGLELRALYGRAHFVASESADA